MSPPRNRHAVWVFTGYCLAGAVYVGVGVAVPDFLLSFWVALAYLLVVTWLVPALFRRLP